MPPTRTMQVWISGRRYIFRGSEIDTILALGQSADTPEEAWRRLEQVADFIDE